MLKFLTSPLRFYETMIVFFLVLPFYDIYIDQITSVSFAWPVCFLYYCYRWGRMKAFLDELKEVSDAANSD